MRVLKALVRTGDTVVSMPAIAYEGKLWLVPYWFENHERQTSRPERMIRFDNLKHQTKPDTGSEDYIVNVSIPMSVIDGKATQGFEVLEAPDIVFPLQTPLH